MSTPALLYYWLLLKLLKKFKEMFERSLKSLCCEKSLKICEIISALFCCWNQLVSYFDKSMNTLIKSE